ncbi:MAG: trypsin-like peptidase domain-containing protein [Clostridia bacterium]|nr:trypsin-like peptidase domain-containing protein [Clostridia bacterium]
MKEFYEFDEERYQKKSRVKGYIAIALIFTLIGGLLFYALSPYIIGRNSSAGNEDTGQITKSPNPNDQNAASTDTNNDNSFTIGSREDFFIDRDNPVADIAAKLEKAVVGITNKSEVVVPDMFFYRQQVQEVEGYGSGIIISGEGHVLTNHHVVEGAKELFVIMSDGETIKAELIGSDAQSDIAVLKIESDNLTVAKIGDSDMMRKGDFAIAIGNPLGHELAGTVNFGVISAPNRSLELDGKTMQLIQTDAAINNGNSGGALVNMNGEVIGMNTVKFGGGTVEGLGFAIPSNVFKPIAQEIIETGKVSYPQKPWLGVYIGEITAEASQEYGYPQGVIITDVERDSPAAKAGMKPADVIIGMDGQELKTIDELRKILESHEVDDVVDIDLWRNGDEFTLKVKLGGTNVYD